MIHIAESKVGRRYGDWFLRHINKFQVYNVNHYCTIIRSVFNHYSLILGYYRGNGSP